MKNIKLKKGEVLALRTCAENMTAHKGFVWKKSGVVKAPDWLPDNKCGHGLHGLLWGEGDATLLDWSKNAIWMVLIVEEKTIINLEGKIKFRSCRVAYCGDRKTAADIISKYAPAGTRVICGTSTAGNYGTATAGYYGTATAGYRGTATAGDMGTATAGYCGTATAGDMGTATAGYRGTATAGYMGTATAGDMGTATAGYCGTATAGDMGTATAGYCGTATAGDYGTATAGYCGTATAGDMGTATAGDMGTATAGYRGTATAGDRGTATAGYRGTATAGDMGTATAGYCGVISIGFYDSDCGKWRRKIAEVDGEKIKAGVAYRLDENGNFVEKNQNG